MREIETGTDCFETLHDRSCGTSLLRSNTFSSFFNFREQHDKSNVRVAARAKKKREQRAHPLLASGVFKNKGITHRVGSTGVASG